LKINLIQLKSQSNFWKLRMSPGIKSSFSGYSRINRMSLHH
jgi:hypothetical protein